MILKFKDKEVEIESGKSFSSVFPDLAFKDKEKIVGLFINGILYDLHMPIKNSGTIEPVYVDSEESLHILRHSTSHIMAQAVKHLFPHVKLAIGPSIKDGFYYDFDFQETISPQDLKQIEEEMRRIIDEDQHFERFVKPRKDALSLYKKESEEYKLELINDLGEEEEITFYRNGDFIDLCRGPHIPSTGYIKAYKLLNIAGAYWRGDERNPMLTRIYGTSFFQEKLLTSYLVKIEEAKRRDHRKLGKELELFSFHDEGPGFAFWLPKGVVLRNILLDFWREEHRKAGYVEVQTPLILKKDLWIQSGHWENYRDNMYITEIDESPFAIKPMNCPGGMLLYKEKIHSYRDFPMRVGEVGLVHRHEKSGVLHGLFRVRSFTQDDAHIFMLPSQIKEEIIRVIELTERIYEVFGFPYHIELSTRPDKSIGTDEQWDLATKGLEDALIEHGKGYELRPKEGAFYGPKIDFHLEDCLGRFHQCGTIQLDMSLPERFDLNYISSKGKEERPVVIHRTVLGSIERFIGILIEHYGGRFPLWLAPVQVVVMPITEKHVEAAGSAFNRLNDEGIRAELDDRNEKLGYKMREAEVKKIPYIVVMGQKEIESDTVSVRKGGGIDMGPLEMDGFVDLLKQETESKKKQ
ncbi:MAG: threonine--tRNA ligase [Spirochaetota bacterium]|nr:MAG: threonine--tRNA ligase [Spirochaetota bacterium]